MADYRLSVRADSDLLDIFVYGISAFGEAQAERYHSEMTRCFVLLASQPRWDARPSHWARVFVGTSMAAT